MTRLSCLFVLGLGALVGCGGNLSTDTDSTAQAGASGTAGAGGAAGS
ncbi:MAG: amino acid ABC transporter substrate-binding protein, partial [Myxococcales bacterium]